MHDSEASEAMIQYTDTVQVRDRLFRDSVSSCCSLAFMILSVSVASLWREMRDDFNSQFLIINGSS